MTTTKKPSHSRARALAKCRAEVASYEQLPPSERQGRPLLLAFVALQTYEDVRDNSEPIPAALSIPAATVREIQRAMARVAAAVAAIESVSRAADLPKIRQALGLSAKPVSARARERASALVAAVHRFSEPYGSDQELYREVGKVEECSAATVRRAWLADLPNRIREERRERRRRQPTTLAITSAAVQPAGPQPVDAPQPARKKVPDRSKVKAAINWALGNDKSR